MENNTIGLYGLSWRLSNRFFINPLIDAKNNRKDHKNQIIQVYKDWRDIPISIEISSSINDDSNPLEKIIQKVDLITFNPSKLHVNIIGSILPILREQDSENTSSQYWAISHLKGYKETWKNYDRISICQEHFNEKITKFLNGIREHLRNLIQDKDNEKIELLMRFWLYKIYETSQPDTDVDYKLMDFASIKLSENEKIYNPYKEHEEKIKESLKTHHSKHCKVIDGFNRDITIINKLILDFQNSLRSVIDNSITGLKGSCPKEEQLTYLYGVKSFFSSHWHSVLMSSTYSRLESLFHISLRVSFPRLGVRGYSCGKSGTPSE